MFCTKCGRPIPEGQSNCSFCEPASQAPLYAAPQFARAPMDLSEPAPTAAPVQQPAYVPPMQEPLYQPPVQQPVYQAPVQQAPYQAPVQQPVYQAPVQQPAPQQPAFELNIPSQGRKPKKKKGSGGKVVLAIIALLLVVGIVLAAFNWKSITRFFNRTFGSPAAYLQDVQKEDVAQISGDVAAAYDQALAIYHPEGSSASGTITLEMGDTLMTVLNTALSQSGMELDLSWVKDISLSPKVEMYENTMKADVGVGINGANLATVSAIWDMENQQIYIGVPELHSTYVQLDAIDVLGYEAQEIAQNLIMSRQMTAIMLEALPTGEQIETLLNRYLGIVIEGMSEAEKANETVKAGGLEQDLLVVSVELSQKDILNIAKSLLETAQDDADLEDIMDNIDSCMEELSGQRAGIYDAFSMTLEEALDELDYIIDEAEKGKFLTFETFLDSKDTIVGRTVTVSVDGEKVSGYYITVTEGDKWAFEADMEGMLSATGEGTIKDGKRSGSYTLAMEGMEYITLEIENYTNTDGTINGTFRLIPEEAVYEMMDLDSSITSILGQAALSLTLNGEAITLGIEAAGSELLSFSLSGKTAAPSPISLPAGVSVDDDEAGMKWVSELDLDAVLSNLEKAGVPSEYMDIAEQAVEMFRAEFN